MPLDNILKITEMARNFLEYHHRTPNIIIIGKELQKEMDLNRNPTTLLSELERLKCITDLCGNLMFKIIAFSDDIEGFILISNTLVSSYSIR